MLAATGIELRGGHRLLLEGATFRIAPGDRIGLVGRNGSGKTTLTKVLAGAGTPTAGQVTVSGEVGYLPQDPRTGDLGMVARDRILSARGLDTIIREMRDTEGAMASADDETRDKAMSRYTRLEEQFTTRGGYAAESEAAAIASALGLDDRILGQSLATLSGGQRRRVELSRILFSGASTLLLDEPTNHLDADSVAWLRDYLRAYKGGLLIISHDVEMLETVVNRVFHLDANRAEMDMYNIGWKPYLLQRETDERRRKRERLNAEKKAGTLMAQADKMRAKATKAVAAQNMAKRAQRLLAGIEGERVTDKVAKLRFPDPASCGMTRTERLRSVTVVRLAGDLHRHRPGHRPRLAGRRPGPQRRRQDHPAADPRRRGQAGHGRGRAGARAQDRLLRPRAREPRHLADGPGEHEVGGARSR